MVPCYHHFIVSHRVGHARVFPLWGMSTHVVE